MNAEKIAELRALLAERITSQAQLARIGGAFRQSVGALLDEVQNSAHRLAASQRGNQRLSDENKRQAAEIERLKAVRGAVQRHVEWEGRGDCLWEADEEQQHCGDVHCTYCELVKVAQNA